MASEKCVTPGAVIHVTVRRSCYLPAVIHVTGRRPGYLPAVMLCRDPAGGRRRPAPRNLFAGGAYLRPRRGGQAVGHRPERGRREPGRGRPRNGGDWDPKSNHMTTCRIAVVLGTVDDSRPTTRYRPPDSRTDINSLATPTVRRDAEQEAGGSGTGGGRRRHLLTFERSELAERAPPPPVAEPSQRRRPPGRFGQREDDSAGIGCDSCRQTSPDASGMFPGQRIWAGQMSGRPLASGGM